VWRGLFPKRGEFFEFAAIFSACIAGFASVPAWAGVIGPAMALSLLGWARWRDVVARASEVDADWRELAERLRPYDPIYALKYFARGHATLVVVAAHMLNNCLFTGLAYGFGYFLRRLWEM
jgi:hypothetical protein